MANGTKLLNENIDPKTWKGYVVRLLEDLTSDIADIKKNQVEKEDFEELQKKVDLLPSGTQIKKVESTLYGDEESGRDGLVIEVKELALSHKIKSSWYGILGGGGVSALIVVLYFLLRGHL